MVAGYLKSIRRNPKQWEDEGDCKAGGEYSWLWTSLNPRAGWVPEMVKKVETRSYEEGLKH